jgi:hypothetical protein
MICMSCRNAADYNRMDLHVECDELNCDCQHREKVK